MFLKNIKSILLVPFLLCGACGEVDKKDLSGYGLRSNVPTTEEDGVITGEFKKDITYPQILVASQDSDIRDTYMTIMPGSLAIDTAVSLGKGGNRSENLLQRLNVAAVIANGVDAVNISANPNTNLTAPLTLNIPLPLDFDKDRSLALTMADTKVGLLYEIQVDGKKKVGLKVLGDEDLVGAYIKFAAEGFGWFRLVGFASEVENVEVTVD